MSTLPTEEQRSIRRTARDLVQQRAPVSHFRELRDRGDATGFSRELFGEMCALGLATASLPEGVGGAGLGWTELGIVLEECGRTLVPTPLVSTILLGAHAMLASARGERWTDVLAGVCAGRRVLALAHDEGVRFAPYAVAARAERSADGWRINGNKVFVLDGHVADALVVVARTSGVDGDRDGLTLFLVPAASPGVTRARTSLVDSRNAARVRFEHVAAGDDDIVGEVDHGADVLDVVLDRATVGLSAEMLGSTQEAFDRTIAYLKERKQFGVPIGSFQALKHRAATMFCEIELARAVVAEALAAVDAGRDDVPILASVAKARASDTFVLVANEAVQMHGGIGVTDEHDIGFFLKRARVAAMTLGDGAYHRDRFARLNGY